MLWHFCTSRDKVTLQAMQQQDDDDDDGNDDSDEYDDDDGQEETDEYQCQLWLQLCWDAHQIFSMNDDDDDDDPWIDDDL